MTTPAFTRREAQSLDAMMAAIGGEGWSGLDGQAAPVAKQLMAPSPSVSKFLWGLSRTVEGRALIEWMMDITFRAPFRATGKTIEETALLAATRQGIEGVGEVILAAIQSGADEIEREQQAKEAS